MLGFHSRPNKTQAKRPKRSAQMPLKHQDQMNKSRPTNNSAVKTKPSHACVTWGRVHHIIITILIIYKL